MAASISSFGDCPLKKQKEKEAKEKEKKAKEAAAKQAKEALSSDEISDASTRKNQPRPVRRRCAGEHHGIF